MNNPIHPVSSRSLLRKITVVTTFTCARTNELLSAVVRDEIHFNLLDYLVERDERMSYQYAVERLFPYVAREYYAEMLPPTRFSDEELTEMRKIVEILMRDWKFLAIFDGHPMRIW